MTGMQGLIALIALIVLSIAVGYWDGRRRR